MALRNKIFHQWNRYYLLSAVVLSVLLPCIHFTITNNNESTSQALEIVQAVTAADIYIAKVSQQGNTFSAEQYLFIIYAGIVFILLSSFLYSLRRIYLLIRSHTTQKINDIKFINTDAQGTPFSFLDFIFWNNKIDLNTPVGQKIFQHEAVHVREKHSLDKIFIQIVLVFYWCNPIFWLIKKELRIIHEFIADKKAVEHQDTAGFAVMILQATYPHHFSTITNQFFHTSIKRRLAMLSKITNPRLNYISRVLALPLIAIVVLAFTIKSKSASGDNIKAIQSTVKLNDTIPSNMGKLHHVDFLKDGKALIFFEKGLSIRYWEDAIKEGYITKEKAEELINDIKSPNHPLIVVNGKIKPEHTEKTLTIYRLDSAEIKTLSKNEATKKYGKKGENGVIEIKIEDVPAEITFTKVEQPASFPGGNKAWLNYLGQILRNTMSQKKNVPAGEYKVIVKFLIKKDGSISNVEATTRVGFGIEEEVIQVIQQSPKWIPAKQNGYTVASKYVQSLFFISDKNGIGVGIKTTDDKKKNENENASSHIPLIKLEEVQDMAALHVPSDKADEIISFNIAADINGKDGVEHSNLGSMFDVETKEIISKHQPGHTVLFDRIIGRKAGKEIKLPVIVYRIQ
jgi:beta-lactamase regulating signal transducer with metallopeptidase domain